MSTHCGNLGLSIPKQTQSSSPEFGEFKLLHVKQWLAELPSHNLAVMNKSLYEFLVDLNRTQLPPQHRYEVLETVLPQISFLTQTLSKQYLDETSISSDKKRKINLLIEILNLEINYGYKIITESLAKSFRKQKSILLKALHRIAIISLEQLQRSYLMYTAAPNHLWQELHIVYSFAEKNKLINKHVDHYDARPIRHTTILDAYKHALLLSCSNPYRLRIREMYKLNFALEVWSDLLTLTKLSDNDQDVFMVDLETDRAPFYKGLGIPHSKHCLSLDFSKIHIRLDQLIFAISKDKQLPKQLSVLPSEVQMPLNVLKFLKSTWSDFNDRRADRIEKTGTLRVTLGLKSTYAAIVKHTKVMNKILYSDEDTDNEDTIFMDSVPLPQFEETSEQVHNEAINFLDATYVDISPAGFCFEWKSPTPKELVAGEIIGIEQNSELEGILCIGMIRWIKHLDAKTVQCGVKLISPYAIPMLTVIPDQPHKIGVKTLLLPAESRYHPQVTLLTPALPFKAGMTVNVTHNDQVYEVHLKSVVDNSSIFNQFNISFENEDSVPFVHLCHPHQMDALWNKFKL